MTYFLKGNRIHLRALKEQDLNDNYLQWLNDEEVCRYNSHALFPNSQEKMRAYYNSLQAGNQNIVLAIVHSETETHIGNVSLQNINWVSRNAEFAILVGDKNYWGGGYGEEAASLIVKYGFERLNLHRIYCGTIDGNKGMVKLAEKLRMKPEGIRVEAIFKNGKYADILEFGVLRRDFLSEEVS